MYLISSTNQHSDDAIAASPKITPNDAASSKIHYTFPNKHLPVTHSTLIDRRRAELWMASSSKRLGRCERAYYNLPLLVDHADRMYPVSCGTGVQCECCSRNQEAVGSPDWSLLQVRVPYRLQGTFSRVDPVQNKITIKLDENIMKAI